MTYTTNVYAPDGEHYFTLEADTQKQAFQFARELAEAHHPRFRLARVYQTGVGPSIGQVHPTR